MGEPAASTRKDGSPTLEARGWSWPPFAEGHTLSVKSGAWSPRFITAEMDELRPRVQAVIDECPWVRPVDEFALIDFVRDMARAELLERWLHEHGDRYPATDEKRAGELRDRDLRELGALRNRLLAHRARLGLDPASRARMNFERTLGLDLDAVRAAGRTAIAARVSGSGSDDDTVAHLVSNQGNAE